MIEFRNVSKTYDGNALPAVADFSFTVGTGTTTCFVGPSGCGKTTLLRMVNRMVEPDSGRVLVRGADVADSDPVTLRRSIGYVMQHSGLMPHRTVLDNVADIAKLSGAGKGEAKRRAADMLELVNLGSSLFGRYPAELSGGQAQRVGVARGMVTRPDILIMDEPFGAVDPVVRRSLQREVLALKDTVATTVLMVTHDIDEAFLLGDEVVILGQHARIEQAGTPEKIVAHPANEAVREFIGAENWHVRTVQRDGETLVVDATGKVRGVLK
ncbi:ABC transporter ATP-binding protein [Corynebacterium lipophiloflavum]|uniref:ABC-type quaternary amine transporter n=1 Tax=Corynebacterium lipophiloflavum (strain ATCC 700352 / DSM 44291 / CCUG 37336 / JCM 10383 / DMMZ 1944) TaxID=525263 RepID=C0XPZ1_CORLD|nr:ATP-binding cassette domain-containing protein [Corynebacterium lipophiloflavum]EEI17722.1 ABC transporter, ATP-binding protein [Corynebacterium lipophiloflavum DSM 44291]